MIDDFNLQQLVEPLQNWFQNNARILPWRENPQAYYVWISEIMLQQTRVEAVKPYFDRFIRELPDVKALAECPEDKLLKLWEGLGYYNRVRNLKVAANQIMDDYGGEIPSEYEELLKLKGIGSYTAGAISSIAFGKAVPAVDGNVLRVISRVTADDSDIMKQSVRNHMEKKLLELMRLEYVQMPKESEEKIEYAEYLQQNKLQRKQDTDVWKNEIPLKYSMFKSTSVDLGERRVVLCTTNSSAPLCHPPEVLSWKEMETPTKTNLLNSPPIEVEVSSTSKMKLIPSIFNQALMELGATVCVPNGAPHCEVCPWKELCEARKQDRIEELPVKKKAKARRIEEKTVLIVKDGEQIALHKRAEEGLLAGLYELPNIEGHLSEQEVLEYIREKGYEPVRIQPTCEAKHIFSHVEWRMKGYVVFLQAKEYLYSEYKTNHALFQVCDTLNNEDLCQAEREDLLSKSSKTKDVQSDRKEVSEKEEWIFIEVEDTKEKYAIPSAFSKYTKYLNLVLGKEAARSKSNQNKGDD